VEERVVLDLFGVGPPWLSWFSLSSTSLPPSLFWGRREWEWEWAVSMCSIAVERQPGYYYGKDKRS